MTSRQFVDFLERKFKENNITKIVPDQARTGRSLSDFYAANAMRLSEEVEIEQLEGDDAVEIPDDLEQRVRELLDREPTLRWSDAVQRIVSETEKARIIISLQRQSRQARGASFRACRLAHRRDSRRQLQQAGDGNPFLQSQELLEKVVMAETFTGNCQVCS